MKNKGLIITLIILLSLITIAVTVFFINILNNRNKFNFNFNSNFGFKINESKRLVIDNNYETNFTDIVVNSKAANVYVKQSDDNNIRVEAYSEKDDVEVTTTDSKLNIKSNTEKCKGFCLNQKISKINIYVPKDYSNNFKINNKYGDANINEFSNMNLDVVMDAGDVEIIGANKAIINNKYGDISVLGYVKDLEISDDCGDIEINKVDRIVATDNYGDIEIKEVNDYLDLKNDCGDIEIGRLNLKENSTIIDKFGDIEIGSINNVYVDAKTKLGDVKISRNNRNSSIVLKIDNKNGDIEVK